MSEGLKNLKTQDINFKGYGLLLDIKVVDSEKPMVDLCFEKNTIHVISNADDGVWYTFGLRYNETGIAIAYVKDKKGADKKALLDLVVDTFLANEVPFDYGDVYEAMDADVWDAENQDVPGAMCVGETGVYIPEDYHYKG